MEPGPLGAVENRLSPDSCKGSLSLFTQVRLVCLCLLTSMCVYFTSTCVFVRLLARCFLTECLYVSLH